jgi:peptide/nickel transport system ATP-binding protein
VMYAARVVEQAPTDRLYTVPEMPYTLGLLTSIPRMDRDQTDRLDPIRGNPPSPLRHPSGCVFHPRCNYTDRVPGDACATVRPELLPSAPEHLVRCHIPPEERRQIAAELVTSPLAGKAALAVAGGAAALPTVGTGEGVPVESNGAQA